jgi:hypothetical protein
MLTDRYQVATIPPLFRLPGYLAYRTVGSKLVVSAVAWQWIFQFGLPDNMSQYIRHRHKYISSIYSYYSSFNEDPNAKF